MISVIIDNYNYAGYISEAIESVFKQTCDDWELIIVDDGSTDESLMIAEKYSKLYPGKLKIIQKENGGQASCLNIGYRESRGDILAFLDSDDYWFPTKLEAIVEAHRSHRFVSHGKHFSDGRKQNINRDLFTYRSEVLRKYGVFETCDVTTSTLSITRDLAEQIFPIPEKRFRICADHFVNYLASYYDDLHYISEELSFYRIHDRNGFVTVASGDKAAHAAVEMDNFCREVFNERLSDSNCCIPAPSLDRRKAMWREYGDGFEILPGKQYVIYGIGYESHLVSGAIKECGGAICGYCDTDPEKQGTLHDGMEVMKPEDLVKRRNEYYKIVVASVNYCYDIASILDGMNFQRGSDYIYTLFL